MNQIQKFKIYKYKKGFNPIVIDSNIHKFYHAMFKNKEKQKIEKTPYDINNLLNDTNQFFMQNQINLHKILYVDEQTYKKADLSYNNNEELLSKIYKIVKKINPLDIPKEYSNKTSFTASVKKYAVIINNDDYLEKTPVIFNKIYLGIDGTNIILPEYIHELIHTQLDSSKGSVVNYHNTEILPIFMEKLSAFQLDKTGKLLKRVNAIREKHLLECLSDLILDIPKTKEEKLDASIYIISTIKANKLFEFYQNSEELVKKNILKSIQNIFDNKTTLEEMLEQYNIKINDNNPKKLRN